MLLTVVAVAIGLLGLDGIRRTNDSLESVYRDRVIPLQQLKSISDDYAVLVIDCVNKANAGMLTAEAARNELRQARTRIDATWRAYLATRLTPEEARLANELNALFPAAEAALMQLDARLASASGAMPGQLEAFDGPLYRVIDPLTAKIAELVDLQLHVAEEEYAGSAARYVTLRHWFAAMLVGGVALGLGTSAFVSRSTLRLMRGLRTNADELARTSGEVASAATQVSAASQSLAQGASEQASSLEETSASLEEMTGMTKRTAEITAEANALAQQARETAKGGTSDMREMTRAMHELKASSSDIAKILKTIDEIAFQTNILALNAAVEAARAGEAGLGFAVVADEVRNLAKRCADASHETAGKIERAIGRAESGALLSDRVAGSLTRIDEQARKLAELVAEAASASSEQSRGIDQVTVAVSDMDKVTQANAASAEECASAAEELNGQAARLRESVLELQALIQGTHTRLAPVAAVPQQPVESGGAIEPGPRVRRYGASEERDRTTMNGAPKSHARPRNLVPPPAAASDPARARLAAVPAARHG